jgi:hypothetical protein
MADENDKIKFTFRPEDIVQIECLPNTIMTLELGQFSTKMIAEMIAGTPRPLLCDLTNVVKMTHDCRKHFAGEDHAVVFTKCALIVTSPISKIIGNFFLGANKPIRPTRLFTDINQGLNWLKG